MVRDCTQCGRSRAAGYILIQGKCVDCGPNEVAERKAKLRAQAIEMMSEADE